MERGKAFWSLPTLTQLSHQLRDLRSVTRQINHFTYSIASILHIVLFVYHFIYLFNESSYLYKHWLWSCVKSLAWTQGGKAKA